jgi:site-specific DNA-methyltransferase (adenine-specific)
MTQHALFAPRERAPRPRIDLQLADASTMLGSVDSGTADLAIVDPPWDLYQNKPGQVDPANSYATLPPDVIHEHLRQCVRVLRPGGRLALWVCWPLLVEAIARRPLPLWLDVPGVRWVTGGAWTKSGRQVGAGYHWRGRSEPVLVGVRKDGCPARPPGILRSGFASDPEEHSAKPVSWQRQWVEQWVAPGGLVVDPYAGLGSVACAVKLAGGGRRYVGSEVNPVRHEEAVARVRATADRDA